MAAGGVPGIGALAGAGLHNASMILPSLKTASTMQELTQLFLLHLQSQLRLENREVAVVNAQGSWRRVRRQHTCVQREGEDCDSLFIIASGEFYVTKGEGANASKLMRLTEFDLIGSVEFYASDIEGQAVAAEWGVVSERPGELFVLRFVHLLEWQR